MKPKIESDVRLVFCCNGCILTEGGWTKTTPDETFQTKTPEQKPRELTQTSKQTCKDMYMYVCMYY